MNGQARPGPTPEEDDRWGALDDWAGLGAISAQIVEQRGEVARLEGERAGMYRRLVDAGVPRAAIARKAGLSDMAVRFVLEPDLKKPRVTKTRRPAKQAG